MRSEVINQLIDEYYEDIMREMLALGKNGSSEDELSLILDELGDISNEFCRSLKLSLPSMFEYISNKKKDAREVI